MKKVGKTTWRALTVLLMVLSESGCSTPQPLHLEPSDHAFLEKGQILKSFQRINPSDGIDRSEACLLSYMYFSRYEGSCGFSELKSQTSKDWIFGTAIGYSGAPGPEIRIDKRSGMIRHRGYPCIKPPWSSLTTILE
jgi:predicted small lipoprotein YifL